MEMKKLLAVVLTVVLMVSVIPFGMFTFSASAATSGYYGYYTYTVSNGEAEITDVDTSISGAVTIPSTLGGYPVTSIGERAFYECWLLTSITIPDSVTSIGYMTFHSCFSLTSITIPDGVTSISYEAFFRCTSLTSITIPDSVTSIGMSAFYDTAYYNNSSNWENGVLYIGKHLIEAKTSISGTYTIKPGILTISDYAFNYCYSLTSITIPDSVTSIGIDAFYDCSIVDIWYKGSYADKMNISIGPSNSALTSATWHYNTCDAENHVYSSLCDDRCNNCDWTRSDLNHTYTNDCDTSCNVCGEERMASHKYDNACDTECNVCHNIRTVADHKLNDDHICTECGYVSYTPGDLTGDNKINSLDGLMLLRHLNGWKLNIASPEAMDVNADGKVNSLDGLMLLRYLNGWNITLG